MDLTLDQPLESFFQDLVDEVVPRGAGVEDRSTLDYLCDLLVRFAAISELYSVRDLTGRRLDQVAEMVHEAEMRAGLVPDWNHREIRRHIGDFTLFWCGVFPEALPRLRASQRLDHVMDYMREGRRAYLAVARMSDAETESARLFLRLSNEFEKAVAVMYAVRMEWERRARGNFAALTENLIH